MRSVALGDQKWKKAVGLENGSYRLREIYPNTEDAIDALRASLGVSMPGAEHASSWGTVPLPLDVGESNIVAHVPPQGRPALRHHFKDLYRREKRRAADAGNAANTTQILASSGGAALTVGGIIALITTTGPMLAAAAIATGFGVVVTAAGLVACHWMNRKKFLHEERMEQYLDLAEELC